MFKYHPNLKTYLRFEGGITDRLGRTWTATGTPTYAGGVIGQAITFDGSSNYITATGDADVKPINNFTFSTFFKATSNSQSNTYVGGYEDNGSQASIIYEFVNNTVEFYSSVYTGSDPRTGSGITVADTNWHHIAYSYDGTNWIGMLDGAVVFNVVRTFSLSHNGVNAKCFLGAYSNGNNKCACSVDEYMYFNIGLPVSDLKRLSKFRPPFKRS